MSLKRLKIAEVYEAVGAICSAATWLEYQLEIAISELDGTFELGEHQGKYSTQLVAAANTLVRGGAVVDSTAADELLQLLSRAKAALDQRDLVVHSTWLFLNSTRPGHVTGQRYRRHEVQRRDWQLDELQQIRKDLEEVDLKLTSASWNAVMPPEKRI